MTAFNDAFYILKNEYMFDIAHDNLLRKGKAEEAMELRSMRQFVLNNENSPDPAMRQQAEDMYQKLTQIMSAQSRTPPMQPPQGPVGEGATMGQMSQPPMSQTSPLEKAWGFLRKNVIGMQEAGSRNTPIQYNMPPAVASMAQRPQVPETMSQTMETPAPGMFGRFKQPVTNTAQIPTGQMTTGGPATMNVQQNPENPMAGMGGMGQMMAAPGAAVERMPRPSPFASGDFTPNRSLAGQGYTVNDAGEFVRPENPYEGRQLRQDFEDRLKKPIGEDEYAGRRYGNTFTAQQGAADQFTELGY
ncbi:MAG: hypothetical protein CMI60_01705 [Parvibaculum sp.]|nr:hypothetical protein [Parvibaculum sp.]